MTPAKRKTPVTFGSHLAALLDAAKLSQRELARRTGINYVTINKMISGRFRNGYLPEQESVERIAKAVPCSIDDYLLLFRLAGRVPQQIINRFCADEIFAEICWKESRNDT